MKELKLTYSDLAIGVFVGVVIAGVFVTMIFPSRPSAVAIQTDYCECLQDFELGMLKLSQERPDLHYIMDRSGQLSLSRVSIRLCETSHNPVVTDNPELYCDMTRAVIAGSSWAAMLLDGKSPHVAVNFNRSIDLAIHVYHDLGCADE